MNCVCKFLENENVNCSTTKVTQYWSKGSTFMALDSRCTSTTPSLSMNTTSRSVDRLTPNSSISCTPRSTITLDSSFLSLKPKLWSCQGSMRSITPRSRSSCDILMHKPRVVPMHPTKTCDALRNLTTRDKESMIEEIAQLKKALLEKDAELRRRKVHTTNVESENRYHDWTYIAFF